MKTLLFDTKNDQQFNSMSWLILGLSIACALTLVFIGPFENYKWNVFSAWLAILPGFFVREWYNFGHSGFAFALTALFFVAASLCLVFAWTSYLRYW